MLLCYDLVRSVVIPCTGLTFNSACQPGIYWFYKMKTLFNQLESEIVATCVVVLIFQLVEQCDGDLSCEGPWWVLIIPPFHEAGKHWNEWLHLHNTHQHRPWYTSCNLQGGCTIEGYSIFVGMLIPICCHRNKGEVENILSSITTTSCVWYCQGISFWTTQKLDLYTRNHQ